jgi:hypothetical protein
VVAVEVLTVGALFDMFEQAMRDVGRLRGVHTRVGRTMRAFFGGQHAVRALDEHELERYLHARRRGTVVVSGKRLGAVRDRALQEDMETLRRVLRWALIYLRSSAMMMRWQKGFCAPVGPCRTRFGGCRYMMDMMPGWIAPSLICPTFRKNPWQAR